MATGACEKRRRAREQMFAADPKCHWCKEEMILLDYRTLPKGEPHPDNAATIEHLRSRLDPKRTERPGPGEKRWVLGCRKCNGKRAAQEEATLTYEELNARRNRHRTVVRPCR